MLEDDGPHLQPLSPDAVPSLEPIFELSLQWLGFIPNDLLTVARKPELAAKAMAFSATVVQEAQLEESLVDLINLIASAAAGCRYCVGHTANKAGENGLQAKKIAAIWEFEHSPLFDARERAALSFAMRAVQTPCPLSNADYEHMRTLFSEREICEVLMLASAMGFWNRWNDSVATTLEDTPLRFSKRNLDSAHWRAGKHDSG